MGKSTFLDKIKEFYWRFEGQIFEYLLLKNGFNFGRFYMEELFKMYNKHKDEINFD